MMLQTRCGQKRSKKIEVEPGDTEENDDGEQKKLHEKELNERAIKLPIVAIDGRESPADSQTADHRMVHGQPSYY